MDNNKYFNNFISQSFVKQVGLLINKVIEEDLVVDGLNIVESLTSILGKLRNLKGKYPEVYNIYHDYLIKAEFIALPRLKRDDIIHIVEHYFGVIFKLPLYDINEKVKGKLVTVNDLKERDVFKKQIVNTLLKNSNYITEQKIKINKEILPPTISNWLKDYNIRLGTEVVNKLEQGQYLTNSENIINISKEEKGNLTVLFNFYEMLKTSSRTPNGIEENFVVILPNGEIGNYSGGVVEKIPTEIKKISDEIKALEKQTENKSENLDSLQQLASKYPPGSLERKGIEEEIRKLEVRSEK